VFQGDSIYQNPRLEPLKRIKRLERYLGPKSKRFVAQRTPTTRRMLNYIPPINKAFHLVEHLPVNLPIVSPRERNELMLLSKPLPEQEMNCLPAGDAEALLMYSSGTTQANPKATPITHAALAFNVQEAIAKTLASDVSSGDKMVAGLPMYHIYGLLMALATWERNAQLMLVPDLSDAMKYPEKLLNAIAREKATYLPMVPDVLDRILDVVEQNPENRKKLDTVRFVISGGAHLPQKLHQRFYKLLPDKALWEGYGMTEIGVVAVNKTRQWGHVGTAPAGVNGIKFKILNPDDKGYGELWVQTPGRAKPYQGGAPEGSDDSPFKPGHWFRTGDIARFIDAKGNTELLAREDDIINIGGEKFTSADFNFMTDYLPIRKVVTFQLPLNEDAKIVSVVLLKDGAFRDRNTEQAFLKTLNDMASRKKFNKKLVPNYILPLTGSAFPVDLVTKIGKIRGRAYLKSLREEGIVQLESDGLKIHHPERL
jgi:acyl-CoA synthetase (AMP-forming)/AMP-acid ligase II